MLNNKNTILAYLKNLNLGEEEASLYLELLKGPNTHLGLARATGINRTKVYRLVDSLELRSLVTTRTDDTGTFIFASDPATLEIELVSNEEKLKGQRAIFEQVLPVLNNIKLQGKDSPLGFAVHTYEGVEGFRQMLWHELKAKGEMLIFGSGKLESLVESVRWSEKHRAMTVKANYTVRELVNPGKKEEVFTKNKEFMHSYNKRWLSENILCMEHQIAMYNDTVATYNWRHDQKVGFEVVNKPYTQMMRQIFEQYWKLSAKNHA
jgi:sugar-specific transcriptional regulator TrmB